MSEVQIRDLVKAFGPVRAVNHVSFTVAEGSMTTMLGPSGCGKTTILRCIAGLATADAGDIVIGARAVFAGGRDLVPVERRNLGMVFQSYAIWPHMTIERNVAYGLTLRGLARAEIAKRVDEALTLVRLNGFGERYPSALSGGQMQRVVLARALAYRPELLLLDEPLANLDAHLREEMRQELKRIQHETHMTMIAVTHDQSEALALSDQIIVMANGSVLQHGAPEELFRRPKTADVARFLGATNSLTATRSDNGLLISAFGGEGPSGAAEGAAQVDVLFRPGDVTLKQPGSGGWPGEIVLSQYLGTEVQYLVRCAGRDLTVRAPVGGAFFVEGAPVTLHVAPEALHIYPEAAA